MTTLPCIARAAITAILLGASAQATILNEYSNVLSFNSAASSTTTQTFTGATTYSTSSSGITAGSVNYLGFYNESSSVGYDTYRYTPTSGGFDDIGSGAILIGGSNGAPSSTGAYDNGIGVNLSSLSNITAVSFNFSAWRVTSNPQIEKLSTLTSPITLRLEVTEAGYGTQTRNLIVPTTTGLLNLAGFYGFTTEGTITGIRLLINVPTYNLNSSLNTDVNRVILDNFQYGQIAAQVGGGGTGGGDTGAVPEPQTYLLCAAGLFGAAILRRKSSKS